MTDAASAAILRDVFALGMFALGIGILVYAIIWKKTGQNWSSEGLVPSKPYDAGDGIVALMLLSFFGYSLLQTPHSGAAGGASGTGGSTDAAVSIQVLVLSQVFFIGVGLSLLLYLGLFRGLNPIELFGFGRLRPGKAAALAGIWVAGAYAATIVVQLLTKSILSEEASPQENVKAFLAGGFAFKILLGASAIIVAPLTEELIFRGFLYGVAKRFTDRWFATAFTAVIFAAVHDNVGSLFPLLVLAIFLAIVLRNHGQPACAHVHACHL